MVQCFHPNRRKEHNQLTMLIACAQAMTVTLSFDNSSTGEKTNGMAHDANDADHISTFGAVK